VFLYLGVRKILKNSLWGLIEVTPGRKLPVSTRNYQEPRSRIEGQENNKKEEVIDRSNQALPEGDRKRGSEEGIGRTRRKIFAPGGPKRGGGKERGSCGEHQKGKLQNVPLSWVKQTEEISIN